MLRRPSPSIPEERGELGRRGERAAAVWLQARGYKVLRRNFRGTRGGEVDVVCRHGEILAFVEVKTRAHEGETSPSDAVTRRKRDLIRRGAREWLARLDIDEVPVRFDVVEVILTPGKVPGFRLLEDAFGEAD